MQTNGSLSSEQLATLQSILTFLESFTTALDVDSRPTSETDVELTRTVRDLGLYCKDRMLSAFPSLAEWRALGDGSRYCLAIAKKNCPICDGTGKLTGKQAKRLKYALDLAVWARELQKRVEAEEANQGLTPEDLQFLADLGIGLGEEEYGHESIGSIVNHKRSEFLTNGSKCHPQQSVDWPLSRCFSVEPGLTWSPFLVWYDPCI